MKEPRTALLLDAVYRKHDTGEGHPEAVSRYVAVTEALEKLAPGFQALTQRPATEDEVALCHTRGYIATAKRDIRSGLTNLTTGDTAVSADSLDVALRAAGGVCAAVDAVVTGKAKNAFCAVRPPGHHATPARGMGFCVFNNIAVGARYAQKRHHVARVLIADWDVHHGNGTQDIFYEDGSVLFLSTHQHPWYPGSGMPEERGEGKGEGRIHNFPFPAGAGRSEILPVFQKHLSEAAAAFRPDLVMISAGFDSRAGDPLGRFRLTDTDFRDMTLAMMEIADRFCGGRVVSVLEGGYSLSGLAAGVTAHAKTLAGI
ncbi:MAG: histone deacetylase [Bryobacterales bacterium]|nr:histone deacetylase [Bryobacterales bacterium]